jgi:hypothetical protein
LIARSRRAVSVEHPIAFFVLRLFTRANPCARHGFAGASRIDGSAGRCIIAGMFGWFKGCRLARMSSGRYCLVRDLGLVKGGKGMRHHEVVVAFSVGELFKWLRRPPGKRFEPEASADLLRGTNP